MPLFLVPRHLIGNELPYHPSCPSIGRLVCRSVGLSVSIFTSHVPIGALVFFSFAIFGVWVVFILQIIDELSVLSVMLIFLFSSISLSLYLKSKYVYISIPSYSFIC